MAKGGTGDRFAQANMAGMVLIRLCLGAILLADGILNLLNREDFLAEVVALTSPGGAFVTNSAWDGFRNFIATMIAPSAELFAWVLLLGSLLIGTLLFIGLLTRLAAFLAIVLTGFYLCASWAYTVPLVVSGSGLVLNAALLVMSLAVLIAAAGRTCGFDALLARRSKVKLFW